MSLTETQMELVQEPIKKKWRCTRGVNTLYTTLEGRQGHYVYACDANEAIAYMRCKFPNETNFTAHPFSKWLGITAAMERK